MHTLIHQILQVLRNDRVRNPSNVEAHQVLPAFPQQTSALAPDLAATTRARFCGLEDAQFPIAEREPVRPPE
jgi:hypothetical protein